MKDAPARTHLHGPAMGTRWSVALDGARPPETAALHAALAATVGEVDAQLSPWQAESALNRFNRLETGVWSALPASFFEVLVSALEVCQHSHGAFDPNVGALTDAWGFGPVRDVPDAQAIRAARAVPLPTPQILELDPATRRARKHAPLQLDLCGIAKGYAVDRMAAVLHAHGVAHALVALDGELRTIGPQADGQPWPIALEAPTPGQRRTHGVIELQDLAVATSGDYRHAFEVSGAHIAHSMDARTRAPVRNDVASVTVLASACGAADAWATALLVAGAGAGLALAQQHGLSALWLLRRGEALVELGSGLFATPAQNPARANTSSLPLRKEPPCPPPSTAIPRY